MALVPRLEKPRAHMALVTWSEPRFCCSLFIGNYDKDKLANTPFM